MSGIKIESLIQNVPRIAELNGGMSSHYSARVLMKVLQHFQEKGDEASFSSMMKHAWVVFQEEFFKKVASKGWETAYDLEILTYFFYYEGNMKNAVSAHYRDMDKYGFLDSEQESRVDELVELVKAVYRK